MPMLPEEKARVKIDKQLRNAGWDIVARNEYLPNSIDGTAIRIQFKIIVPVTGHGKGKYRFQ